MPVGPATHTWFWLFVALFIVGAFLGAGGIMRTKLDVIDRSSRLIAAVGLVLLLGGLAGALVVAAGAPGSMTAAMKQMVGLGDTVAAPPPKPAPPGAKRITVTGVDFKFEPTTITVPAGQKVDVAFTNGSSTSPHTFTLQSPSFELKADPGQSQSGELPKLKPGTYQFICSIPGHEQLGMVGKLIVK